MSELKIFKWHPVGMKLIEEDKSIPANEQVFETAALMVAYSDYQELAIIQERFNLIKELLNYHPGDIQTVNDEIANYTGGMRDTGDLNWRYCMFEASIQDLKMTLQTLKETP